MRMVGYDEMRTCYDSGVLGCIWNELGCMMIR